ncbi:MAG TPA: AAA family ATPase [Jatrophihabitantaceae bacterium]|jgi:DNA-binding CsgD family transcriptional regulator
MLYGRDDERAVIDSLLLDAQAGRSGALVIRGEAGIGKTALLDYAAQRGSGLPVLRGVGIETESELPFAGLHLLLHGHLDHLQRLPAVQAEALRGALGLGAAARGGDRFLIGLAVLSLLADLADDGPLLCLIDDAQWVDPASMDALLLAARRLEAEGIALIVAARDEGAPLRTPGLPELRLTGLDGGAAGQLLAAHAGELSAAVRDRILAESAGNPLALIELPNALGDASVSVLDPLPVPHRIQQIFQAAIAALPEPSRDLLLIIGIDDTGDLDVVLRAAEALSASAEDLAGIEAAQLIRLTSRGVTFRHPLIRAATLQDAPLTRRWAAHRALVDALPGEHNAARRAWHLAALATGPDEQVAAELERSAEHARERGGIAAIVTAYERAARLSTEPAARARRLTVAAEAAAEVGDLHRAEQLVDEALATADDPILLARLATVRGHVQHASGRLPAAFRQLHTAVTLIHDEQPERALWLLMEMTFLTYATGDHADTVQTAELLDALRLPPGHELTPLHQVLRWGVARQVGASTTGLPPLPETAAAALRVGGGGPRDQLFIVDLCLIAGDNAQTYQAVDDLVAEIRAAGAVGLLPQGLAHLAYVQAYRGRHRDARASAAEAERIAQATGQPEWIRQARSVLALVAAIEGDEERCREYAGPGCDGELGAGGTSGAQWALGLLDLGLGRADAALARLEVLSSGPTRFQVRVMRSAPDLVEAAVRAGEPKRGAAALERYEQWAVHTGQPWAEALLARCQALLAPDEAAEPYYRAALARHEADRPLEPARTALLYGEWLRRMRRRTEARDQLRVALDAFDRLGARPWADRARGELRATGEMVAAGDRTPELLDRLTPQELQVVRLAAAGMSNRAIGAQLFLSPRTVAYHLYKAFPKLGVASRGELARLPLPVN